jgi:hypothetical protein
VAVQHHVRVIQRRKHFDDLRSGHAHGHHLVPQRGCRGVQQSGAEAATGCHSTASLPHCALRRIDCCGASTPRTCICRATGVRQSGARADAAGEAPVVGDDLPAPAARQIQQLICAPRAEPVEQAASAELCRVTTGSRVTPGGARTPVLIRSPPDPSEAANFPDVNEAEPSRRSAQSAGRARTVVIGVAAMAATVAKDWRRARIRVFTSAEGGGANMTRVGLRRGGLLWTGESPRSG